MKLNWKEDITIDQAALDQEWLRQPSLFGDYAEAKAEAEKAADEAKEYRDLIEARLDKEVRSNPSAFGLDKVTDKAIGVVVSTHPDFQKAVAALIQARYELALISGALEALRHRKSALENLVVLHGQNYFSTPRPRTEAAAGHRALAEACQAEVTRKIISCRLNPKE
jgi:hypothetical protein